jgi:hypothetical protein
MPNTIGSRIGWAQRGMQRFHGATGEWMLTKVDFFCTISAPVLTFNLVQFFVIR